jgi:hypothetical protein
MEIYSEEVVPHTDACKFGDRLFVEHRKACDLHLINDESTAGSERGWGHERRRQEQPKAEAPKKRYRFRSKPAASVGTLPRWSGALIAPLQQPHASIRPRPPTLSTESGPNAERSFARGERTRATRWSAPHLAAFAHLPACRCASAVRTRFSDSSAKLIPDAVISAGKSEIGVKPGNVFTSEMYHSPACAPVAHIK